MKQMIKPLLRLVIGTLARLTLRKHQPTIVAIVGDGPTSVVREYIYGAIKEGIPTRRNLELPEAEFSIPLTTFAYPNYPKHLAEWSWIVIKTFIQLFIVRPYYHVLVLEMHPLTQAMWERWWGIVRPGYVVMVGEFKFQIPANEQQSVTHIPGNADLEEFQKVAANLASQMGIDEVDVELGLETVQFPEPRLRILQGVNDSVVIDATHYYFPIRLESVLEVVAGFEGNKVVFTSDAKEIDNLEAEHWQVNPIRYQPQPDDVILLRGTRTHDFLQFRHLVSDQDLA